MKKMLMLVMIAFTMMSGLFAYEPNPELFKVVYHRSSDKSFRGYVITYRDEVEPQSFFNGKRYITILNANKNNIKREATFHYEQFDVLRQACAITLGLPNKYNVKYSDEQLAKVKEYKNIAINKVPFITEENFNSMTESQYVYKFTKYMKKIIKQNKNK